MASWIMIAIIGLLIIFLAVFLTRKEKKETDYKQFFTMGVVFLIFGVGYEIINLILRGEAFEFNTLLLLGLIFTLAGLANKNKWGKE
ncbi:hypothetical protein GOV13_03140 [Candidatus Pacearchaeota archaeon]|nr:hypothetical protein [Candidatus Pacearchaeota archaeon]